MVEAKFKEFRQTYGVKNFVLVRDRGKSNKSNEAKLAALPDAEVMKTISALTYRQIVQLLAATDPRVVPFWSGPKKGWKR